MSDTRDIEALVESTTEIGQLRRDLRTANEKAERLARELSDNRRLLSLFESIEHAQPTPPEWTHTPTKGKHSATPVLLITDTHFDEVVNPDEIMGVNAYNREIGYQRIERAFHGAARVAKDLLGGWSYDGVVVLFGGDIVTGEIHDELTQTNEATVIDTMIHWLEPLAAGVKMLREEFGRVHVAGVVGNHGRNTRKPRAKRRVRDNFDWAIYRLLARDFRRHTTVTFQVDDSPDAIVPIYDTRLLLTHGDQFRGGTGISGALAPLMLGEHRKRRKHSAAVHQGRPDLDYDVMVMGHWHQRLVLPGLIVGDTLKGYDEYAAVSNFPYAPPSQELMVVAPEHGIVANAPVYVQDRQAEGW